MAIFETNLQEYLSPAIVEKLGYEDTVSVLPESFWKEHALWEMKVYDANKALTKYAINSNLITDIGAISMLKNTYYSSGGQVPIFQYVALAQGTASTQLATALSTSTPATSIAVNALPAGSAIVVGQQIILTSGANTQTVTCATSGAAAGATSVTVTSFTPNFNYPVGTAVQPQPAFADNPSSLVSATYVGLSSGAFTYTPTTGNGNRQVAFTASFTGTSGNAGTYTEAWICNTNPVASTNQTSNHLVFAQTALTNGGVLQLSFVERL